MHFIDQAPKDAAISLLRMIAYHERRAHRAEESDVDIAFCYHEACGKEAQERLVFCEKYSPEEVAAGRLEYAAAEVQKDVGGLGVTRSYAANSVT